MRRVNVLNLEPRDLNAPGVRGFVNHRQKPRVDLIPLAEERIQLHRAHNRTDVGHGEINNGRVQIADLVSGPARVNNLVKNNPVNGDHCVIRRDDFLTGNVEHLLAHINLRPYPGNEGHNDA